MVEQAKQTEQEQQAVEDRKRFNRQINYFIMRYMWQVIRGRSSNDNIYLTFNTSRERYTRIIDTGRVRYGNGEVSGLHQLTGLRQEVFRGDVRFKCPHRESDQKDDITQEQWEELFVWRKEQRERRRAGETGKEERNIQKLIYKYLRGVDRNNVDNVDFYRLCYFLKENEPSPVRPMSETVRAINKSISGLTFDLLDKFETGQLRSLQKLLKEKSNLITGMIIYKEAKTAAKKQK